MNMNREEKQLEMANEVMVQRINEMKTAVSNLIMRIEHDHENFTYPDALDAFAVISGQMNTLMRLLKSDKMPLLKGLTAIPLELRPDKDTDLLTLTEGRLEMFNHEVVPDYLRTKPDPEVESRHHLVEAKGSTANPDNVNKQAAGLTKLANHVLDLITNTRDDWEASERGGPPSSSSVFETQELVTSLHSGKAFKIGPPPNSTQRAAPGTGPPSNPAQPQGKASAKGMSTIKTTIKPGRNY